MDACGVSSSSSFPSSSSCSVSVSTFEKYDVFLSFRGEDTRDKFTSHLRAALNRKKIKTYIDEENLQRGEEISPALLAAIQKSKISIIVFSKDYASSSWCLNELVHILECHRENNQMVIPIFYEIDPSQIRKQEGSYGEAFLKHEERFKDRVNIVQKWRDALTELAHLSGWDSQVNRPESKLVEAIVEDVSKKLSLEQPSNSGFEGNLIGIDKQVEEIKSLLSVSSPKVHIVGIWGMGGIGKTTLAQVIFNQLSSQFEACCFVANVRQESEKGSLINLRNKLLAELLNEENLSVGTPSLGPIFVKERLRRTKVLIVLDDVTHVEQLNSLVVDRNQFSGESRIVITTRDATLLRDISVDGIYEVKQLDFNEALQLFNMIAFRGNSPSIDYIELSKKVVEHAGGIPLAITVLGSHFHSLRSQSKEGWEMALDKLKIVPHGYILNVLRISYDGLDDTEKNIFLDIACFFKEMRRDYVENILNACDFFANNGIDGLVDKSLITIKHKMPWKLEILQELGRQIDSLTSKVLGECHRLQMHDIMQEMGRQIASQESKELREHLWMHDLLQEMGQQIVSQESKERGERSRLWIVEDACHVLGNNVGTSKIQGIFLDLSEVDEELHLEPTIFKCMHNLRLLKIYYSSDVKKSKVLYLQDLQYLPSSLRYLEWHAYPVKSLPSKFKLKNLVELKMPCSHLEQLWDGVQDLNRLRSIDLRHSIHLTHIPDLSRAPNLEIINLESCTSLLQVPWHSLQNYDKLTYVNLRYCKKLHCVPDRIFDAAALRILTLQGCSNLNTLPMTIITRSLVSLDLSSTGIVSLPSSIDCLSNLSELFLNNCTRLANLPSCMNKMASLKNLQLRGCSILQIFPELPWGIQELHISGTAIKEVASSSIEGRSDLLIIDLSDCKSLQSLPANIFQLQFLFSLSLDGCSNLKILPEISGPMEMLKYLNLGKTGISELPPSIGHLRAVEHFKLSGCENLQSVPDNIFEMFLLESLDVSHCPKLEYFPTSTDSVCQHLEDLHLESSNIIEIPESIKGFSKLRRLNIRNCKNLCSLPELPLSLEFLDASGCTSLEVVSNSKRALEAEFWRYCPETFPIEINEYIFCDCLKLGQEERQSIITEFWLRVLRAAKRLTDEMLDSEWLIRACCPGNEIPKWFEHRKEGSFINIMLPQQLNDDLGFVVCVVADSYSDTNKLNLICKSNFKPDHVEEIWHFTDRANEFDALPTTSTSSHVYVFTSLCFEFSDDEEDEDEYMLSEASFDFSFEEWVDEDSHHVKSSKCEVKKCGIHILHLKDLEEFKFNFRIDELLLEKSDSTAIHNKPESSNAHGTIDSDTDELHPKRIK